MFDDEKHQNLGTFLLFSCSENLRHLKPKIMPNLMAYAPQQFSSLWGSWIQGTSKNPLTEMVQQKQNVSGWGIPGRNITC